MNKTKRRENICIKRTNIDKDQQLVRSKNQQRNKFMNNRTVFNIKQAIF